MADDKEPLQVDADVLDAWAKEKGITPEALKELREKIDAKEVEKKRGTFWRRVMKVLGITALIGGSVAAGVYVAKEATTAMPEAAALVAKREWGERGEALKAQAEEVKKSADILVAKMGEFLSVLPKAASNYDTIMGGITAIISGVKGDTLEGLSGGNMTPDQTMASMSAFLENDPKMGPPWKAVVAAYEDLKGKGLALASMEGKFDVTEVDKQQAWEDYKAVLWDNIKEDFGIKAKALPTSSPAPESRE